MTGNVVEVTADAAGMTGAQLEDGSQVELDALVVAPVCRARADLLVPLGVQPSEVRLEGYLLGTQIDADLTGATSAAGVWVAGNVANVQAQVISSAAAGLAAGAAINIDLITADAARAVRAYRYEHVDSEDAWDQRYAEMPQVWSGRPNAALVAEVTALPPGRALDVGCGEGADAEDSSSWCTMRGSIRSEPKRAATTPLTTSPPPTSPHCSTTAGRSRSAIHDPATRVMAPDHTTPTTSSYERDV